MVRRFGHLPVRPRRFTMPGIVIKSGRTKSLLVLVAMASIAAWVYWQRPRRSDMAAYVPADSLAFVEANDLTEIADGIEGRDAWKALAGPIGARSKLGLNRWLIRVARWTGLGSVDAVLIGRSQAAVVITGGRASEAETALTIKPLAALVIETHTSQRRMRPVLEKHIEAFARRAYGQPTLVRKQIDGVELAEWSASDGSGQIITAFVDTVTIVGNDESAVLRCVDVRRGKLTPLAGNKQLADLRQRVSAVDAFLFGFVAKAGVKPALQAWALYRAGSAPEAATVAPVFADTFGNLIEGLAWSSRFAEGGTEDRCFLSLSEGVAGKLQGSAVPDDRSLAGDLTFVPPDTHSVSVYHLRDVEGLWRDLNAQVSSHADVVGAIAARPLLRSLFKPYGIDDPDTFVRAVGTHVETIRLEENSTSVLATEAFDRQSLRRLAQQRLGPAMKTEIVDDSELLLSGSDNWAASFADNHFLIGPAEAVRRCLQAKAQTQSLTSVEAFRRALRLLDVSLPITTATFTDDRRAAISLVELFSQRERSAFSTNAPAIDEASRSLPYSVNVTILKDNGFEWTSRSAFGLLGSLLVKFAPENAR